MLRGGAIRAWSRKGCGSADSAASPAGRLSTGAGRPGGPDRPDSGARAGGDREVRSSGHLAQERVEGRAEIHLKHLQFGPADRYGTRQVVDDRIGAGGIGPGSPAHERWRRHRGDRPRPLRGTRARRPHRFGVGLGRVRRVGAGYRALVRSCRLLCARRASHRRGGGARHHGSREVPRRPAAYASGAGRRPAWEGYLTFPGATGRTSGPLQRSGGDQPAGPGSGQVSSLARGPLEAELRRSELDRSGDQRRVAGISALPRGDRIGVIARDE